MEGLSSSNTTPKFIANINVNSQTLSDVTTLIIEKGINVLIHVFTVLGIFSNLTNMVVFGRLGFSTVSNISLFVLSLSDFFLVAFIAHRLIVMNPFFDLETIIAGFDLVVMQSALSYSFMAMSSWVTALITMERCCCIMFPIKVKLIFTRRNVIILVAGMVLYQVGCLVPHYLTVGLTSVTSPRTNKTVYVMDYVKYDEELGILCLFLSLSVPSSVNFVIVLAGTILLVTKLRQSAEFRSSMAVKGPEKTASTKETMIAKCVIGVCVIYIVCQSPDLLTFVVSVGFPSFHFRDPVLGNVVWVVLVATKLFQTISASVNIFVYFRMMRQYRETLKKLFRLSSHDETVSGNP